MIVSLFVAVLMCTIDIHVLSKNVDTILGPASSVSVGPVNMMRSLRIVVASKSGFAKVLAKYFGEELMRPLLRMLISRYVNIQATKVRLGVSK